MTESRPQREGAVTPALAESRSSPGWGNADESRSSSGTAEGGGATEEECETARGDSSFPSWWLRGLRASQWGKNMAGLGYQEGHVVVAFSLGWV